MHRREPRVLEAEAQVGNGSTAVCLFYKTENGCKFRDECSYAHRQVDEQPSKKSKKNGDRLAVSMLKNTRQLGCVSQDMEPPKSSSILRKSSNILHVQLTKAV